MLIESHVRAYLASKITSVSVFVGIPSNRPASFIAISKVDSGKTDQIDAATIEIHSYAETKLAAAELDQSVREYMETIADEDTDIMACKLGGGNDLPDTVMKSERYRSYFNLYF